MVSKKFFRQPLCWEYYNNLKNYIVLHFIKDPNFEFKNWKKQKTKKCQNLEFMNVEGNNFRFAVSY